MKEFIHSRYFVAITAVVVVAAAVLSFLYAPVTYKTADRGLVEGWGAGLSLAPDASLGVALGLNGAIAILLCYLNRTFNVLRTLTRLQGAVFLIMQLGTPAYIEHVTAGVVLCLAIVVCYFIMFWHYGQPRSQRSVFLVFLLLSAGIALNYAFAFYLPVFLLVCISMRIMSLRTLLAAIMGIATPWIIFLGLGIVEPSQLVMPKLYSVNTLWSSGAIFSTLATVFISVVVAVGAWSLNIMKVLSYNNESRGLLNAVTVTLWITVIAMAVDFNNVYAYLAVLNCCAALQIGHLFGVLYTEKESFWAIFVLMFAYISLFLWKML